MESTQGGTAVDGQGCDGVIGVRFAREVKQKQGIRNTVEGHATQRLLQVCVRLLTVFHVSHSDGSLARASSAPSCYPREVSSHLVRRFGLKPGKRWRSWELS